MSVKILVYTREPIDNVIYDPRLAYSMHLGFVDENGKAHALNHNSGVLFARATENEDGSLNPMSLEKPCIFRMRSGGFVVVAKRILGDGGEDESSKEAYLVFTSKDLVRYWEEGLVKEEESPTHIAEYVNGFEARKAQTHDIDISDITGCIPFQVIEVTDEEFDYLRKKLTTPEICGLTFPERLNARSADDVANVFAQAQYTDGTSVRKRVLLDTSAVDFSKPGEYEITGRVLQKKFSNPIAINRADPDVIFWEGKYYFIATNDADGNHTLYVRCSDTLEGLAEAEEHLILDSTTYEGIGGLLWAPEFHEINGRLYIFHAATREEFFAEESRLMTLREGGDPTNRNDWSRPQRMIRADGLDICEEGKEITLDMTCFKWEGSFYVIWSQRQFLPKDLGAWLYIAKLDPEEPWKLLTDPLVLSKPDLGWGNNHTFVEEGPFALIRGDKLYVTYSAAAVDTSYVVSYLEIEKGKNLLFAENWRKNNYPILCSRNVEGEYGTGHNAYVIDEDGTVWNTYHARFGTDAPRSSGIRRVHFDVDGAPMLDVTQEKDLKPEFETVRTTIIVENK